LYIDTYNTTNPGYFFNVGTLKSRYITFGYADVGFCKGGLVTLIGTTDTYWNGMINLYGKWDMRGNLSLEVPDDFNKETWDSTYNYVVYYTIEPQHWDASDATYFWKTTDELVATSVINYCKSSGYIYAFVNTPPTTCDNPIIPPSGSTICDYPNLPDATHPPSPPVSNPTTPTAPVLVPTTPVSVPTTPQVPVPTAPAVPVPTSPQAPVPTAPAVPVPTDPHSPSIRPPSSSPPQISPFNEISVGGLIGGIVGAVVGAIIILIIGFIICKNYNKNPVDVVMAPGNLNNTNTVVVWLQST